jgi:hypothetical protein
MRRAENRWLTSGSVTRRIDLDLRQAGQEAQGDADHDHAERGRHRDALGYGRDRHDGDDRGHRDDGQLHVISFSR